MSARCQLVFCPLLHSSLLLVSDTLNISVVIVTSMELLFRLNLKCQFNICLFIPINSMYSCKIVIIFQFTVLLNSDQEKKKLIHPKSIPTSQCYYCTLIFNNFEMFRMKTFEIKPQTGGVNA